MQIRRTSAAVTLVVAGAFALAACSSSSEGAATNSATTASASTSASASNDAAQPTGKTVKGATLGAQLAASLSKAGSYTVVNDTNAMGTVSKSTSKVLVKNGKYDYQSTSTIGGKPVEMISLDGGKTIYAKSAGLFIPKWTKVDVKSKDKIIRQVALTLSSMRATNDPTNLFAVMKDAEFVESGKETVNGVETTKYVGQIPAAAIVATAPTELQPILTSALGKTPVPMVMNVNAKGQPVKQALTMTLQGAKSEVSNSFTDIGKPVSIKAPI